MRGSSFTVIVSAMALAVVAFHSNPAFAGETESCRPHWEAMASGGGFWPDVDVLVTVNLDVGPELYAGGMFDSAGGQPAESIARWDGQTWRAIGAGLNLGVLAIAAHDDGVTGGPMLYAGGSFLSSGSRQVLRIARWDGRSWNQVGEGFNSRVCDLIEFGANGKKPLLYAVGAFRASGSVRTRRVAAWDGRQWQPLGQGIDGSGAIVLAAAVFDDGRGPALYVAGQFTLAGGRRVSNIARWDGGEWSSVGDGTNGRILDLEVFDDGTGPALYAAGSFTSAGGQRAKHIAKWDGQQWTALGQGTDEQINRLHVFNEPDRGPMLYVGGDFDMAGPVSSRHIARWIGTTWESVDAGLNGPVHAMTTFPTADGRERLFIGGDFTEPQGWGDCQTTYGSMQEGVTTWDGQRWGILSAAAEATMAFPLHFAQAGTKVVLSSACRLSVREGGIWNEFGVAEQFVAASAEADGFTYIGGGFTSIGGVSANGVARWDGRSFHPLGQGVESGCMALAIDGSKDRMDLYAGGSFLTAGSAPANRVARWDGQIWHALGEGLNNRVRSLCFDQARELLYACGLFTQSGPTQVRRIAQWNETSWSQLADGLEGDVWCVAMHDAGDGEQLYVGGDFMIPGQPGNCALARWDGRSWTVIADDTDGSILSLATFDDGSGEGRSSTPAGTSQRLAASRRLASRDGTVSAGTRWIRDCCPGHIHSWMTNQSSGRSKSFRQWMANRHH